MTPKDKKIYLNVKDVEKCFNEYAAVYSLPIPQESKVAVENYINSLIQQVKKPEERVRLSKLWKLETEINSGKNLEKILETMKLFTFELDNKKRQMTKQEDNVMKEYIKEFVPKEMQTIYFNLWEIHKKKNGGYI